MDSFTEVFAWGSDHSGQLGLGGSIGKTYSIPRLCSFNVLIKELSCGEEHAGFISSQGHVYMMGSNSEGRLGIDDRSLLHSSSPCLVSTLSGLCPLKISCGWGHSAVVTSSGGVYTWGLGEFGALGLGSDSTQWTPQKMQLPEGFAAISASCGSRHTAVLAGTGRVATVGCGEAGQLGTGKRGKETLPVVIESENIAQVACGIFHTALLSVKGAVFTMGGNSFGQLGHGNKKSTSVPERVRGLDGVFVCKIACGYHTAAICEKGGLYVWGTGCFGEHLSPHKQEFAARVKEVAIGSTFTIAVLQDMSAYTWGTNSNGELGLSDFEKRDSPSEISALVGKKINAVACGGSFCIALGSEVGRSRTPTHVRSSSKVEYLTEHKKTHHAYKFSLNSMGNCRETKEIRECRQNDRYKVESSRVEDNGRTEMFRRELDQSTQELGKLKSSYLNLERVNYAIHVENNKLKEQNHQLLLRLQEEQMHLGEFQQISEENYQLKKQLDSMQQNYSEDISNKVERAYADREIMHRELEEARKRYQTEVYNRNNLEKSYQMLSDENKKITLQIEAMYAEFSNVEKQLKYSKEDEITQHAHENELFHQQLSAKDIELERVSVGYHNLLVQYNRLIEENNIYRQSIVDLEEKNSKLFENLEKELSARAHEYKERTLSILNTPMVEREARRSISPVNYSVSPTRKVKNTTTVTVTAPAPATAMATTTTTEVMSRIKLSETTQSKIGNTAARLLARMEHESALSNIRVSSPSRRSPDRPAPFKPHQVSKEVKEILKNKLLEYRE